VARERPHALEAIAVVAPDQEADAVAAERADRRADDRVGAVDHAQADQRADREQDRHRRHRDAEDHQGVEEHDGEDHQARSDRVGTNPGDERIELGGIHSRIIGVAP
jgi:hypothetical protein